MYSSQMLTPSDARDLLAFFAAQGIGIGLEYRKDDPQ
jgi:hypothetical protein